MEHWMHSWSKALHQLDNFLTTKDCLHRFYDAGITALLLASEHQAIQCRLRLISQLQQKLPPRTKMLHLDHTGLQSNEGKSAFCAEVLTEMKKMKKSHSIVDLQLQPLLYPRSSQRRMRADSSRIKKIQKELKKAVQSAKKSWISQQCKRLNEFSSGRRGTKNELGNGEQA